MLKVVSNQKSIIFFFFSTVHWFGIIWHRNTGPLSVYGCLYHYHDFLSNFLPTGWDGIKCNLSVPFMCECSQDISHYDVVCLRKITLKLLLERGWLLIMLCNRKLFCMQWNMWLLDSFSWLKLIVAASSPLQQVSLVINII